MNKQINFKQETAEISRLRHHPKNAEIYDKTTSEVDDLVDSIDEISLLEPLVVNSNYEVLSGNRRLKALRKLKYEEVPVIVRNDIDTEDEMYHILSFNQQRRKKVSERRNEVMILKHRWEQRPGSRTDLVDDLSEEEKMTTTRRIAVTLGISENMVNNLIFIDKQPGSHIYFNSLDSGKASISGVVKGIKENAIRKEGNPDHKSSKSEEEKNDSDTLTILSTDSDSEKHRIDKPSVDTKNSVDENLSSVNTSEGNKKIKEMVDAKMDDGLDDEGKPKRVEPSQDLKDLMGEDYFEDHNKKQVHDIFKVVDRKSGKEINTSKCEKCGLVQLIGPMPDWFIDQKQNDDGEANN